MLDIHLVCAIPNTERYGQMIAYFLYLFALNKKCTRMYTSPRTPKLRDTFIKYGFEHFIGVREIDEVLIKRLHVNTYVKTNKTRKSYRLKNNPNIRTLKIKYAIMDNLHSVSANSID